GPELAMAYSNLASCYMNVEDSGLSTFWGNRAMKLAKRVGEQEVLIHSLNNVGTAELLIGKLEGKEKLERSLELARDAGMDAHAGRAVIHLVWGLCRIRRYDLALPYVERGLEYCNERDLELWSKHLIADQARIGLEQGRWDEAADWAVQALADPRTSISVP